LQFWTLLSPSPGNTVNLTSPSAPSAWNLFIGPNEPTAEWYLENTSGTANGTFYVQASPNLYGTLDWYVMQPDPSVNDSGTVVIAAPEPGTLFAGFAALAPVLARYRRKAR
jgi:hypothetical protein